MKFIPMAEYFIVKINKEQQKSRKEKIGNIYLHFNEIQMQRNVQNGEIVAIGDIAHKQLPQAAIGDTLIFHHFVEGDDNSTNEIFSDETFNYYNVTAFEFNGRRNETYAVVHDGKIIPHKDFVFIEPEKPKEHLTRDEYLEKNVTKVGSIFVFTNWTESREEKEEKAKNIMSEVKNMSKGKSLKDDVKRGLEEKQKEAESITASLNKKQYLPYKVHAFNPEMPVKENIYALNIAANVKVEYNNIEYTIIQSKYCGATE